MSAIVPIWLLASLASAHCSLPPNQGEAGPFTFTIGGNVRKEVRLTRERLSEFPSARTILNQSYAGGMITGTFEGVSLFTLVHSADPYIPKEKGSKFRLIIRATATDHYGVSLSYAELDPDVSRAPAMLALRCNGVSISPTLIIPKDRTAVRYVHEITRVDVSDAAGHGQ